MTVRRRLNMTGPRVGEQGDSGQGARPGTIGCEGRAWTYTFRVKPLGVNNERPNTNRVVMDTEPPPCTSA
jgi:hypothetical protein